LASRFETASLTKAVFAYAVMKLVDAGGLSLDTPLSDYLPEPVSDERMKRITARMVLSHTTGFQNEVMPGETLRVHLKTSRADARATSGCRASNGRKSSATPRPASSRRGANA